MRSNEVSLQLSRRGWGCSLESSQPGSMTALWGYIAPEGRLCFLPIPAPEIVQKVSYVSHHVQRRGGSTDGEELKH